MQFVLLKKENFALFISILAKKQKVVAPVDKGWGNYSFEEVSSADKIAIKYIPTILPPKKYFQPQEETLLEYDLSKDHHNCITNYEKMIIFGVHTCDLAGIQCMNMVFADAPKDINYGIRKRKIALIGLECNDYCDEHASCALMGNHLPQGGYDLFFTDLEKYFLVHINTQLGDELIEMAPVFDKAQSIHIKELKDLRERKRKIFQNEVGVEAEKIPKIFEKSWDSKVWDDLDKRCLACANCTNVCPTCYCFDMIDDFEIDQKLGKRYRVWDSCQNEAFAKVSGGESFRKERGSRQRHRYYRKFAYPIKRYARFFCTGCGRCTRACMAKISLKETLSCLAKEME